MPPKDPNTPPRDPDMPHRLSGTELRRAFGTEPLSRTFQGAAVNTTETRSAFRPVKTALKIGGGGFAAAGLALNSVEAWDQLRDGHTGAALWTASVRNTPELAAIAEIAGPRAARMISGIVPAAPEAMARFVEFAPVKFIGGPWGFLAIEGVQQLVNETTGLLPPSFLAQYSINADVNRARAREALFPGDAEADANSNDISVNTFEYGEMGPTPSEMIASSNRLVAEPSLDRLMQRMPNFGMYQKSFVRKNESGDQLVPDENLRRLATEMKRLQDLGTAEGYQQARQLLRNHLIDEVVSEAGELSRGRGTNSWDGERIPQEAMNEAAHTILQRYLGNGSNVVGIYGAAEMGYFRTAVNYLDPSYSAIHQRILDDSGKPVDPMRIAAGAAKIYVDDVTAHGGRMNWNDPSQQRDMRHHVNDMLSRWGFNNLPNPDLNYVLNGTRIEGPIPSPTSPAAVPAPMPAGP